MNGNVKLGRAAACSGEWAQHFSNASCLKKIDEKLLCTPEYIQLLALDSYQNAQKSTDYPHTGGLRRPQQDPIPIIPTIKPLSSPLTVLAEKYIKSSVYRKSREILSVMRAAYIGRCTVYVVASVLLFVDRLDAFHEDLLRRLRMSIERVDGWLFRVETCVVDNDTDQSFTGLPSTSSLTLLSRVRVASLSYAFPR